MLEISIQCENCGASFSHNIDNTDIVLVDGELTARLEGWNCDEFGNVLCPDCWTGEIGGGTAEPLPQAEKVAGSLINKKLVVQQIRDIVDTMEKEKESTDNEG